MTFTRYFKGAPARTVPCFLDANPPVNARRLRALILGPVPMLQARGVAVVLLASVVGVMSGMLVHGMSWLVQLMHGLLFGLQPDARLSAMFSLGTPLQALVPPIGGVILGLTIIYLKKWKFRTPIDPIEANALYGGRMSLTDTFIIAAQTMISSGFGASVGLEAGYTQVGSGFASRLARLFRLRRNDVRILVGCGAAGTIAAAFDAPLTGAFYGFELVIGIYSVANVASVMTAAVSASLTAEMFGGVPFPLELSGLPALTPSQYLPFLILGLFGGGASIAIMYLVTLIERAFVRMSIDVSIRPVMGGVLIGLLALLTPQILSSGHGALHREFAMNYGLAAVASVFVLKLAASAISLGSGFRGGLFFASLFLGALLGKIFASAMAYVSPATTRKDVRTMDASTTLAAFRGQVPLGSAQRVIAVDAAQRYCGMLIVAELHSNQDDDGTPIHSLAKFRIRCWLRL